MPATETATPAAADAARANTATAVFEAHHRGFRVTVRDASRHQIIHQVGLTAPEVARLMVAHRVPAAAVTVLAAQA